MKDNLDVQGKKEEIRVAWWQGFEDGYTSSPAMYPEFAFHQSWFIMTPYQRGFLLGLELRWAEEAL